MRGLARGCISKLLTGEALNKVRVERKLSYAEAAKLTSGRVGEKAHPQGQAGISSQILNDKKKKVKPIVTFIVGLIKSTARAPKA